MTIGRLIHDRAPACRVLFVDYLTIFPPEGEERAVALPTELVEWGAATVAASVPSLH